jgi:hypothetical protein
MAAPKGNQFAKGLTTNGRPPKFETAELLIDCIKSYFEDCLKEGIKATITGMTLWLGFESRSSLDDYVKRGDDFSYIIKRAKLSVENSYENSGTAFDIFALKNMGWSDRQEIEHNGNIEIHFDKDLENA